MPVTGRLLPAILLGVGGAIGVGAVAMERQAFRAIVAARDAELEWAGRHVRATAIALGLEAPERAAELASEGLEAHFPGGWRWLTLPDGDERSSDETLRRLPEDTLHRLVAGETVRLLSKEGDRDIHLTPLPRAPRGGVRLCLELQRSREDLLAARHALQMDLALASAAALALAALATVAAGRLLVARPLRVIRALARRATEQGGDPGTRLVPAPLGGELAGLSRDMNAMYDRLGEAARALADRSRAGERAIETLRRAERLASVGKLAAGIAHELGTPLNVIGGRARAIARTPGDPAEVERQAQIIARQAERMTGIVRQLLDFSRRRAPHMSSVDVAAIARATAELLGPQAKKSDVRVEVKAAPDLPAGRADAAQLEQVLLNLMLNAVQASPGGGEVTVEVAHERRAHPPRDPDTPGAAKDPLAPPVEAIRITVADRGVGIPRPHLPQLFDPFFTTKPAGEGTGLGLPVAWGIVREHGGWIDVESVEGEGARFMVFLPVSGPTIAAKGPTTQDP